MYNSLKKGNMMAKKINLSFGFFNVLVSVWCVVVYNLPFIKTFYQSDALLLVKIILPFFMFMFFVCIHNLILWKKTSKPILYFLFLANGFASYFIGRYNVPLNRMILINLFETNIHEASEFFDFNLFFYLLWSTILPIIFIHFVKINYRPTEQDIKKRLKIIVLVLLLVGGVALPYKKQISIFIKENFNLRYMFVPTSYLVNIPKVIKMKYFPKVHYVKVNEDVKYLPYWKNDGKKNLFVFVLGESARNANFSTSGYPRDTSLPLKPFADNLYAFKKMESCATLTRYSLPCMFTHFEKNNYDADTASYTDNVLDIIDTNGYKVKWFENEMGCNKMCRNVETEFTCENRECFDIELNEELYADLPHINQNSVYVLHQRGSHGVAYYKRYPKEFEKYTPICKTTEIKKCSSEELVNVYDNTIYYTNYVLADLIEHLTALENKYNVVMLYTSDHGESLGENGVYFHGGTAKEQTEVPFILWIGKQTAKSLNLDTDCLKKQAQKSTSHDNLFHTLLGLTGLSVNVYKPELDLISVCKVKN